MNPTLFIIILNVVILAFMGIGFLRGMVGLRYTLVRFALFLLTLGLTFILMGTVAQTIVSAQIIDGKSINQVFVEAITKVELINNMYTDSERIRSIIDQLPGILAQFLSFSITFIALHIISNIIYTILKLTVLRHITWFDQGLKEENKKDKAKQEKIMEENVQKTIEAKENPDENGNIKKPKLKVVKPRKRNANNVSGRSKLYGGLMGAVFGFIVILTILLPVSGIVSTVSEVIKVGDNVTYAEGEEQTADDTETVSQALFGENYDTIKAYVSAYEHSSIGFISGIGGIDKAFVKRATAVTIDGKSLNMIDSIEKMGSIYGDVLYLVKFKKDYKDIEDINNLDVSRVKNIISYMFDNEVFDSLFDELVKYGYEYVYGSGNLQENVKEYIAKIYSEMTQPETSPKKYIKEEVMNLFDIAQHLIDSKVIPEFTRLGNEEKRAEAIENIVLTLSKKDTEGHSYIQKIVTEFKDSKTMNITACFGFNTVIEGLEKTIMEKLPDENLEKGFIGRVSLDTPFSFEEIADITQEVADLYAIYNAAGITKENMLIDLVTALDSDNNHVLDTLLVEGGKVVDHILEIDILSYQVDSTHTILDNICYYGEQARLISVIDMEMLTEENIISTEITIVRNVLEKFYASDTYTLISTDTFDTTLFKDELIKFMNEEDGTDGKISRYVAGQVLSTRLFRPGERDFIVTMFGNLADKIIARFESTATIPSVNTENLYTETERIKLETIAPDLFDYYVNVILDTEDPMGSVIESNFNDLGKILDEFRMPELFADTDTEYGYYSSVMLVLDAKFESYLNFEVALEDTFSWEDTMTTYGQYIKDFLNYQIDDNGENVRMYDIIAGDTEITIEEAFVQMGAIDLAFFSEHLTGCEILNPVQIIITNILTNEFGS